MNTMKSAGDNSPTKELLNRKRMGPGPHPPEPLDHLALAIAVEGGADMASSLAALANLRKEFVDWNEIRVARIQEIARALDGLVNADRSAARMREEYNAFFEKKGSLGFEFLQAGKPAEMRRALQQLLPHLTKGSVSLLLYEFCVGASMPLSDEGLKQARKDGILGKNGDKNQLTKMLGDVLEPAEASLLVQYWELEATGSPYGETGRRESATARRATKAPASKPKAKKK